MEIIRCTACNQFVNTENIGRHLATFCQGADAAREEMCRKFNLYTPILRDFRNGTLTEEELDFKFREIFQ